MQKGRLSAPFSSPVFNEMHQNPSWVFGCWQETFDAVKLASAPLYWAPPTHNLLCWCGEGEHAFPAVQQIQPMGVFLGVPEAPSEERSVMGRRGVTTCKETSVLSHPQHNRGSQVSNRPRLAALRSAAGFLEQETLPLDPDAVLASRAGAISPLGRLLIQSGAAAWAQGAGSCGNQVQDRAQLSRGLAPCRKDIHSPRGGWQVPAVPSPHAAAVTAWHRPHL